MRRFDFLSFVEASLPTHDRKRQTLLLTAYLDASFTQPIGVSVVGGHIASAENWALIEEEWQANLDYWKLDYFHLTDIPHWLGHENGELCVKSFVNIIGRHGHNLTGCTAGIRDADWDDYVSKVLEAARRYPSRYHAVVDMMFKNLAEHIRLNHKGGTLSIIADVDDNREEITQGLFQAHASGEYSSELSTLALTHSQSVIPLQVADLHVGLVQRCANKYGFFGERNGMDWLGQEGGIADDARQMLRAAGKSSFGGAWSYETQRRREEALKRIRAS